MPMLVTTQSQRRVLIDTIEAGIREIMAQAEVGAVGDRPAKMAHARLEIEYVGVDLIEIRVDEWLWHVHVSQRRNGYRR